MLIINYETPAFKNVKEADTSEFKVQEEAQKLILRAIVAKMDPGNLRMSSCRR